MNWWTLPGPRSYIDAIIDDVRQGKSVFLCLPENTPGRLSSCLQEALEEDFGWLSTSADLGVSPIDFLYDLTAPDADPARLRNEANLAQEDGFRGKLIWLNEIPLSDWEAWARFFREYERVSRAVPEARRSYFLVRMAGFGAQLPLPEGVGLSARRWDGWLGRHDMKVYSTVCVRERRNGLETDLATALVADLGGWDPALCDYLAGFELSDLLRPLQLLSDFAQSRGWELKSQFQNEEAWSRGLSQTYLGSQVPHTCYSAFLNGLRHIDYLIWRAEIGVLMPYIEEKRQKLIEQYRMHLKLPHYTKAGVIDDVYDLEIGMLEWMLSRSGAVSRPVLQFVSELKEARNKLSHLVPVDPDVLLTLCEHSQDNR
jgi:hypothetical protein